MYEHLLEKWGHKYSWVNHWPTSAYQHDAIIIDNTIFYCFSFSSYSSSMWIPSFLWSNLKDIRMILTHEVILKMGTCREQHVCKQHGNKWTITFIWLSTLQRVEDFNLNGTSSSFTYRIKRLQICENILKLQYHRTIDSWFTFITFFLGNHGSGYNIL